MLGKSILVVNGPGLADPHAFGAEHASVTLPNVESACATLCAALSIGLEFRQTNQASTVLEWLEHDSKSFDAIIINPISSVYSTRQDMPSYLAAISRYISRGKPVIEVHIENMFRQSGEKKVPLHNTNGHAGLVCGLGIDSYLLAIESVASQLKKRATA